MSSAAEQTVYLKDYSPSPYAIEKVKLEVEIGPETGVPAIFGVLTTDTVEQAMDRAGLKMGNAGWNAALAAIATANILARIKSGDIGGTTRARGQGSATS